MDSLVMRVADAVKVPAGSALAVDRGLFARQVTEAVAGLPRCAIHRGEVPRIPEDPVAIVATGPLTSPALGAEIAAFVGAHHLYFYDAVSPVVEADTIDLDQDLPSVALRQGGRRLRQLPPHGGGVPRLLRGPHGRRVRQPPRVRARVLLRRLPARGGDREPRGDTLLFGPMKPVGLLDPRTGRRPFAVVQLRQDNLAASHFSVVGFQTQLKWGEQKRVFRMVPGLENAEFVRFGMIHRNTYVNAPTTLESTFETRRRPGLFFAGQMSGVEGYVESAASGLLAGIGAAAARGARRPPPSPRTRPSGPSDATSPGATRRTTNPPTSPSACSRSCPHRIRDKARSRLALSRRALASLEAFRRTLGGETDAGASGRR